MKRFAILSVLALAACAGEAELPVVTGQPASAPGGNWVVVDEFATEAVGAAKSPYLGQVVTLEAGRAIDPSGRLCKAPAYTQNEAEPAQLLGVQPEGKAGPRPVVTVTCEGQPFGTFVSHDGGWLTRANAWVLKLAKETPKPVAAAEPPKAAPEPEKPAPVAPPAPAPAPVAGMGAHDMPKPAAKPAKDPRTLVYLASYKTEKDARTGFKTLAKASPILAKQQPVVQKVDLGKKGTWIRLYGMAADEAERAKICKQVGKRVDECGARNRE